MSLNIRKFIFFTKWADRVRFGLRDFLLGVFSFLKDLDRVQLAL